MPGLGTSFGRGGATTAQQDLANADAILSRHNTPNYVAALVAIASPFAAAAFFYDSAPRVLGANLFDLLCAFEVLLVNLAVAWFLFWRFLWRRELTVFHAAVPRVMCSP